MSLILSNLFPILQAFLLFKIWRELKIISLETEKKSELTNSIKKFGRMFAEASGVEPVAVGKKKTVSFEARDDE